MIKKFIKKLKKIVVLIFFPEIEETRSHLNPIKFSHIFNQKILKKRSNVYWPIHPTTTVTYPENIKIGIDTSPGYAPGCYIQGIGKICIGDYTMVSPNVGIISANHSIKDFRKHKKSEVIIGKYCWVGMGSVILPGSILGDHVVVRPNSVVDADFSDGYCILGGNPAKVLFKYPKEMKKNIIKFEHENKYIGFKKL